MHAHKRANQLIIISLGLTTRNNRSMKKRLTAYAATIIAVPESQCPEPPINKATIFSGSTKLTGTINRAKD